MKFIPLSISNKSQVESLMKSLIKSQSSVNRKQYFLIVEDRASKQRIGTITGKITSEEIEDGIGILGYTILKKYWGHGYATEATKCMISFFLRKLKLHRLEASSVPENNSSEKVLKKVGMTCEGAKRKSLNIDGFWYDELQYGILRSDSSSSLGM